MPEFVLWASGKTTLMTTREIDHLLVVVHARASESVSTAISIACQCVSRAVVRPARLRADGGVCLRASSNVLVVPELPGVAGWPVDPAGEI